MLKSGGIPVALPDDPTSQVESPAVEDATVRIVWHRVDASTTRMTFEVSEPEEVSDGVPCDQPFEVSSTTKLDTVDMAEAFDLVVEFARRDQIAFSVIRSRVLDTSKFSYAQACDEAWVLKLTGTEKIQNRVAGVVLMVPDWSGFQRWFPNVLREVEGYLFRMFEPRKSLALTFRLRAFAQDLPRRTMPDNHGIIRL